MTVTYDPRHPRYFEEADVRAEMSRVFDLCQGCRLCFNLCPAFPSLFDMVDSHNGEAWVLSPAEQDRVVDECYQCKLCYVKCPYVPPHEWELDFPRLMMRAHAQRHKDHPGNLSERLATQMLSRTDLLGKVSVVASPLVNKITSRRNSLTRKAMQATVGIASDRLLPPYARQRFSTWWRRRRHPQLVNAQAKVVVFPTCFIEYWDPGVGQDLVKVYERNRVECSVAEGARCCGAPWLHAGEVDAFVSQARGNLGVLVDQVRAGKDVIVAQPTCGYVVKKDYPLYLGSDDANLVAAHTYDASEYLMRLHRGKESYFDTQFPGEVPEQITYHVPCHLQAQNIGLKSRDLLRLTGARVSPVSKCSGIDGTWGYRRQNYELARRVAQPLAQAVRLAGTSCVAGDCHLANGAIEQETGARPRHPIQVIARAYAIAEEYT